MLGFSNRPKYEVKIIFTKEYKQTAPQMTSISQKNLFQFDPKTLCFYFNFVWVSMCGYDFFVGKRKDREKYGHGSFKNFKMNWDLYQIFQRHDEYLLLVILIHTRLLKSQEIIYCCNYTSLLGWRKLLL